ncbi:hypothetical protein KKE26_01200 [bacterium]|nr:hypothetical protein [bacterium]MBU1753345.1 hypothetical protein [bacterium]
MKYEHKPSFDNTIKDLSPIRKIKVKEAIRDMVIFFETRKRTSGLGLKKLRKNYWEIRTDLKDRILFRLKGDTVEFIIVGSHDEIKRYLKNA